MNDSSGQGFQTFVHSIEQGKFAPLLRGIAGGVVLLTVVLLYLFVQFTGFDSPAAMDQGQISRSLASGEGFSTKYIRPMALWQLNHAGKAIPAGNFPDFIEPPLSPLVNTIPLLLAKAHWTMNPKDIVYAGDRIIAFFSILLFLAAVAVAYCVARRLFDAQLAFIACLLVLVTDLLWQFSLSGLPHMLLLLLLMLASWAIVKAMDEQEDAPQAPALKKWLLQALIGALFGLMTLSHWLACWFFFGYLFFAFFHFRPRILPLAAIVGFAVVLTPWIVRNVLVSGHPFGIALYPLGQDPLLLRSLDPDFSDLFYGFKMKVRFGILDQVGKIFAYLGLNLAAGAFFVALLHPFKSPTAARFRWCVLAMWVAAVLGMAAYGPISGTVSELQLHAVFIPLMIFYGLAFLLVLWNRLGFQHSLMRLVFNVIIVFLAAIPMLLTLFAGQGRSINWPPYIPPYIAILGDWYKPKEALCSDMPWAVAWYANRKCLLLPDSPKTMVEISDYNVIGAPISGLYLTPITGDAKLLSEIAFGTYKQWGGIILRQPQSQRNFPLSVARPLPIDGKVILYSDRDRWSDAEKQP
ncbi:MAG: glycosyltransferase family 39 protein [Terrimicrobiaceae bacterium]|nr:glycosyltransferase family 39 protein [Terrimicrobiaceae bacterium]